MPFTTMHLPGVNYNDFNDDDFNDDYGSGGSKPSKGHAKLSYWMMYRAVNKTRRSYRPLRLLL
ncbi:hypothetical protein JL09_g5471 [Pichia kudriavzevii]|uniref:Uncharacterized protein n=1 Tax=Pichia kudriavzevii TaxID=4909 RepID=A0A099NTR9_PICKU|nr:hypothetical protein JL09_g5471 [Pichia kudriavzevii]